MDWPRLLAYITGTVDQELLLRNEYLVAENRILKAQIKARLRLSDAERTTLAEIGHRLGRKALEEVAAAAKPDTILGWYRKLIANKFDGSKVRGTQGRPRIDEEIENLVVRMAKENPSWGYDRIVGAIANLGHKLSDETVGNILRRHDCASRSQAKAHYQLERLHSHSSGRSGWDRFLHHRSRHSQGIDHLLCPVLHPSGEPQGLPGRRDASSG
jgi:putative transposase